MVGDDACSVCASLIQRLLEFMANMERNRQYDRKAPKPQKAPKIKTGKISKKCFSKLQQAGMNFEYMPVPKELMPQFEETMKKMGGTFFTGAEAENNSVYVAVPVSQRNMVALATQHMLSKEIEKQPGSFVVSDENSKIDESEMRITSDVMNSHDIPMFAFHTEDGKYMTVVPKEFEGQYNKALEEVKQRVAEMNNVDVVRFEQTAPLDKLDREAIIVTADEARELAAAAKYGGLDIQFTETEQGIAVLFDMDIADKISAARAEYYELISESENFTIDVTDNTISMDMKKLVVPELSDDNSYFVRIPNTAGKDYLRIDKAETEIINGGKSIKTELDMEKKYSVYDSSGTIKQERSGGELARSYNTRHPHANKDTKIYEHGLGMERVNLFNKEKNEIISVKLESAENMRTVLKEHGIRGKSADMLMEDINRKLSEPQKEIFALSKEKTEIVYADIPNIGEYLAQSQLSQMVVGKVNMTGELPKDAGSKCCVMDNNTNSFAVIPVMPLKEVQTLLTQMGYSEMSAKEIAEKIVRSYRAEDKLTTPDEIEKLNITPFDTPNVELKDCGYCLCEDKIMLIRENDDAYKYMSVEKGSTMADVEKALKENFGLVDDISAAVVLKQLISEDIVKAAEPKVLGENITVSQLSSKYIEITHDGNSAIMPLNKLDNEKLLEIGITEKAIGDIRKSLEKSAEEFMHPDKQTLSGLKEGAKSMLENIKAGTGQVLGKVFHGKGQER